MSVVYKPCRALLDDFIYLPNLSVHALYHNHSTIRRVVGSLFFLEIVGLVVGLSLTLPGVKYDSLCSVVDMPGSIIIYGWAFTWNVKGGGGRNLIYISPDLHYRRASSLIFQSALFSLTLYKFIQAARLGWRNVPLMILLLRDGTWAFLLLFGKGILHRSPYPYFSSTVIYVGQISMAGLPREKHSYLGVLYGLVPYSWSIIFFLLTCFLWLRWSLTAFSFSVCQRFFCLWAWPVP